MWKNQIVTDTDTALEMAKAFIRSRLADGPVLKRDIETAARQVGVAARTLRRAREAMNVIVSKQDGSMTGPWMWELPAREGRRRGWLVAEAKARKNERREKPVGIPGDPGGWTAS